MRWYRIVTVAAVLAAGAIGIGGHVFAAPAPTAHLSGPAHAVTGQAVTLDASASTGEGVRFAWNFGDGSYDMGGAMISHVYTAPGTYTVTVDVADAQGEDAFASLTIVVGEPSNMMETVDTGTMPINEMPVILPEGP
jgi:hypothetical protein